MTQKKEIAIFGAGGFAREMAWFFESQVATKPTDVLCFIADNAAPNQQLKGLPVVRWEQFIERYPDVPVTIAVGDPAGRRKIVERCESAGVAMPTLIHEGVPHAPSVVFGEGTVVCNRSMFSVDIEIGRHVHINSLSTFGHDVRVGDFATISHGVKISGNVHIGAGAYVAVGVSIIDGTPERPIVIGDGAIVAAGACVTGDIEAHCLYTGVPARFKKRLAE